MKADIEERVLHFKQPAGTSRGVYTTRRIWLVTLTDGDRRGVGECAPLPALSCDDLPNYGEVLERVCEDFCCRMSQRGSSQRGQSLRPYPSMLFGLETALLNLRHGDRLFDTAFSRGETGIPINGLVWMGTYEEMSERMEQKLAQGFRCVKLKIGAIDFDSELELLARIRRRFSRHDVELRVDANGAFSWEEALHRLEQLSQYGLHSIEQPIKAGQWSRMAQLCRESPLPIALDEELIGVNVRSMKQALLDTIHPQYIVLKPSLHGGIYGCREWIQMASERGIGSWITSALESNVGLSAIAHFCAKTYGPGVSMPQGLGTGQLFTDNIPMPLQIKGEKIFVNG